MCEGAAGQRREDAPRLLPAVPFLIKCLGLEDEQVRVSEANSGFTVSRFDIT